MTPSRQLCVTYAIIIIIIVTKSTKSTKLANHTLTAPLGLCALAHAKIIAKLCYMRLHMPELVQLEGQLLL